MAKARRKTRNGSSQKRAMRPTWEGHPAAVAGDLPGGALHARRSAAADVHFNLINPKTNNRIRMQTVDAGTGQVVERSDLVKGFAVSQEQACAVRAGRARCGEARIDARHRHRGVRRRHRRSTASTGTSPTICAPAGKTGIEAYARDPRRHGEAGQGGAGPPGDASARAHLCARAARRRHPAHDAARARRDPLVVGGVRAQPAQARSPHAGDRREDHRAAGGRVRSQRVQGPLRGRAARPDQAQDEGREAGEQRGARGRGGTRSST